MSNLVRKWLICHHRNSTIYFEKKRTIIPAKAYGIEEDEKETSTCQGIIFGIISLLIVR